MSRVYNNIFLYDQIKIMKKTKKNKYIQSYAINEERGKALKDKTIELFIKDKREIIKESVLISFLIDNALELIDIDHHGLFINTELEEK